MNFRLSFSPRPLLTSALVLLSCSLTYGDDITWTGNTNNSWHTGSNWDNGTGPAEDDYADIPSGTVNYSTGTNPGLRGVRQNSGTFNITGGNFEAARRQTITVFSTAKSIKRTVLLRLTRLKSAVSLEPVETTF